MVVAVLTAAGAVVITKERAETPPERNAAGGSASATRPMTASARLPRLLDLGGEKCTVCLQLAPILAELKAEYAGRLVVECVDVNRDPDLIEKHGIRMIPTLIFFDASGKEIFRHEGFASKEDILETWKVLGISLGNRNEPPHRPARARGAVPRLFTSLTHAVEGTPAIALGAAFVWGVLSILLSPCHLASIPLIVGFIDQQGRMSTRRAFAISGLFAVGILTTIAAVGAVTAAAGRMMGDVGRYGNYFVAAIFFIVGLHLLDVIPMPWSGPGKVGMKRKGMLAAFILGLVFGVALGPCTFAYMAPMLGVTFKLAATSMGYGILLLGVYGVGHCSVIVLAGTSTGLVQRYLNWNEKSRGTVVVKRTCGVLVLLGGVYLIYVAP